MLGAGEEREEREGAESRDKTERDNVYIVHYKVISIIFQHLTAITQTLQHPLFSSPLLSSYTELTEHTSEFYKRFPDHYKIGGNS